MGFQFEVVYKPRPKNNVVDALSRQQPTHVLNAISISPYWMDFPTIGEEVQKDPDMVHLKENLQSNPASVPHYALCDGLLFFKGRLVLPKTSSLIPNLLAEFHDSMTRDILGLLRHIWGWPLASFGREWRPLSWSTFVNVMCVNTTSTRPCLWWDYCNLFTFYRSFGTTSPWLLSPSCHVSKAMKWFSQWLIVGLSKFIFWLSNILTPHEQWLRPFSKRWQKFMVFLKLLLVIGIPYFLASFGASCFAFREQPYEGVPHIIPRLTDKRRSSIAI